MEESASTGEIWPPPAIASFARYRPTVSDVEIERHFTLVRYPANRSYYARNASNARLHARPKEFFSPRDYRNRPGYRTSLFPLSLFFSKLSHLLHGRSWKLSDTLTRFFLVPRRMEGKRRGKDGDERRRKSATRRSARAMMTLATMVPLTVTPNNFLRASRIYLF